MFQADMDSISHQRELLQAEETLEWSWQKVSLHFYQVKPTGKYKKLQGMPFQLLSQKGQSAIMISTGYNNILQNGNEITALRLSCNKWLAKTPLRARIHFVGLPFKRCCSRTKLCMSTKVFKFTNTPVVNFINNKCFSGCKKYLTKPRRTVISTPV